MRSVFYGFHSIFVGTSTRVHSIMPSLLLHRCVTTCKVQMKNFENYMIDPSGSFGPPVMTPATTDSFGPFVIFT